MHNSNDLRLLAALAWLLPLGAAQAQGLPAPPVSPAPVVNYEYDAQGNLKRSIQAPGVAGYGFPTSTTYDRLDRPDTHTDARLGVTSFGYDGLGRPLQVTDPRNLVTQYPRNGLGDTTQLVSPDTGTASHTYDAAGNLKTRTDSRGVLATYTYDALDRLTKVVYSKSGSTSRTYTWTYDSEGPNFSNGIGRLTFAAYPGGTTRWMYDPQGRVTLIGQKVSATAGANPADITSNTTYAYDSAGHPTAITYPSGRRLTIAYDAHGRPDALSLAPTATGTPAPLLSQIAWQPFGGLASWTRHIGSTTQSHTWLYDASGRLVRYPLGGLVRDLSYDAAGRITAYTHYVASTGAPNTPRDQSFSYDELGRLTGITTATASWSLAYDANGNRTSVSLNGSASTYTTPATSNRLDSVSNPARSLGYDAAGNTVSDGSATAPYTATYSLENRLDQLTRSSTTTTYVYNASGQRVRKHGSTGAASTIIFVYDPQGQLLGEYDSAGAAIREYVWLGSMPVAVFTPDPANPSGAPLIYAIHTDHLGTPKMVFDRNNAQRWLWLTAEPFGTTAVQANPSGLGAFTLPLRMPGQYADAESGLFYNYFRTYDPSVGRYVQSDPIGLNGGINTYSYVLNNPLLYSDPNGLNPGVGCLAGAWAGPLGCGVGAGIGTAVMGGAALLAIMSTPGDTAKTDECPPNQPCQPCKTVSGKVVPVGTIGYRPMDTPPAGRTQHGITGPHYNIYKANQNPKNCQCFWQSVGAVPPTALPPGAMPIEPFAN